MGDFPQDGVEAVTEKKMGKEGKGEWVTREDFTGQPERRPHEERGGPCLGLPSSEVQDDGSAWLRYIRRF